MKGQWIGRTVGDNAGRIIINIDDRGRYYSGVVYVIPDEKNLPSATVSFQTKDKSENFNFKANIRESLIYSIVCHSRAPSAGIQFLNPRLALIIADKDTGFPLKDRGNDKETGNARLKLYSSDYCGFKFAT